MGHEARAPRCMLPSKAKFLRFFGAVDARGLVTRHDGRMSSWPPPPPPRPLTPSMIERAEEVDDIEVELDPDPRELPFMRRDWWVWSESGEPVGPVSIDQIARGILAGKVPLQAWVTRPGDPAWQKVLELRDVVRALELSTAVESIDPGESEDELVDDDGDDDGIGTAIARAAAKYDQESEVFPLDVVPNRMGLESQQGVYEAAEAAARAAREAVRRGPIEPRRISAPVEAPVEEPAVAPAEPDDALTPPPYDPSDAGTMQIKIREPMDSGSSEAGTGKYQATDGRVTFPSDPGAEIGTGEYEPPPQSDALRDAGVADLDDVPTSVASDAYVSVAPKTEVDPQPEPGTNPLHVPTRDSDAEVVTSAPRTLSRDQDDDDDVTDRAKRDVLEALAAKGEAIGLSDDPEEAGPVSTALARALTLAADQGRWDVVLELARQLEARRPSPPAPDSTIFFMRQSSVPPPPEHN